jgi:hypothetical protein
MTREDIARMLTTYGAYISASEERKPVMLRGLIEHVEQDERIISAEIGDDALVDVPMVCHVWRATRSV